MRFVLGAPADSRCYSCRTDVPIGLLTDARFLLHVPELGHPERPERLTAILRALERADLLSRFARVPARLAVRAELERVHTPAYLDSLARRLSSLAPGVRGTLDPDTYYSAGTWEAALLASGGVIDLARKVLRGELPSGLALVRPPGHHATSDRAMGFCILNHVAAAVADARAEGARVAIFDWDVHHGNGTEAIFDEDPDVFYASMHEWPQYPGTGARSDRGRGRGIGATLNVPLPAGTGDADYLRAFRAEVEPAIRGFAPDLILISAGFDGHARDPLGGFELSEEVYGQMTYALGAIQPRRVAVLEGGYDLEGISTSTVAMVDALAASDVMRETDQVS